VAVVFTPIHPLTGAPLSGALGTATMVPQDSSGVPEKRNGISFMLPDQRVDRLMVPENQPGRRPATEAEIQQILKCPKDCWKYPCSMPNMGMCVGSSCGQFHPCATQPTLYARGLRQFSVGSVRKYFDTKTGLVVVVKNTSPLETAYDFVKDNLCWVAAGALVASGAGAPVAISAKATCEAVRASLRSGGGAPAPSGGAPAPGFDPGAGGEGNVKPEKPSWISQHPVATGAIAVGGMGAIGAVLLAIFRR
jgi:hypothetical protein